MHMLIMLKGNIETHRETTTIYNLEVNEYAYVDYAEGDYIDPQGDYYYI
jgi:hypothetical protein